MPNSRCRHAGMPGRVAETWELLDLDDIDPYANADENVHSKPSIWVCTEEIRERVCRNSSRCQVVGQFHIGRPPESAPID